VLIIPRKPGVSPTLRYPARRLKRSRPEWIYLSDGHQGTGKNENEEAKHAQAIPARAAAFGRVRLPLACGGSGGAPPEPGGMISETGTVRFVALEGGFYGIVADGNGRKYEPGRLEPAFRQDGLRVRFRGRVVERGSVFQWGTPVDIEEIETLPPPGV
jgi:hypothetical protein